MSGTAAQVVTERSNAGQPHRGKVLALITPHLDDGPIFAGGTVAKLMSEGYTGNFIGTSNDEKDSYHMTLGKRGFAMSAMPRDLSRPWASGNPTTWVTAIIASTMFRERKFAAG